MNTVFTSSGLTPARSKAARMAVAPSRGAGTDDREPRNAPIGVRAAPTITTFFPWDAIVCSSRGGRRRFITRTRLSSRSEKGPWRAADIQRQRAEDPGVGLVDFPFSE